MKRNNGITLIALVVTIVVLLILAGISISMLGGENGIITKAQEAKEENRGGTVEERRNLWKVNQMSDENTNSNTAQTLDELLADLESEGLLTSEEIATIKEAGVITIGSHIIDFGFESNNNENWNNLGPGLYETKTKNIIKTWEELKEDGDIVVDEGNLKSISPDILKGDLIISKEVNILNQYGGCRSFKNSIDRSIYSRFSKYYPRVFVFRNAFIRNRCNR